MNMHVAASYKLILVIDYWKGLLDEEGLLPDIALCIGIDLRALKLLNHTVE